MNYTKIFIAILIIAIIFFVVRYFIKKGKEDKIVEQEIQNINNKTGGISTTTNPPPQSTGLKVGDTLRAKYNGVKIYRKDFTEFRTLNENEYVGRLDGNYSHEAFYEISTPSTESNSLLVAKVSVKK